MWRNWWKTCFGPPFPIRNQNFLEIFCYLYAPARRLRSFIERGRITRKAGFRLRENWRRQLRPRWFFSLRLGFRCHAKIRSVFSSNKSLNFILGITSVYSFKILLQESFPYAWVNCLSWASVSWKISNKAWSIQQLKLSWTLGRGLQW